MGNPKYKERLEVEWLIKSAERMLEPVARLLVGKLSCDVAAKLLRESFVREAKRQLEIDQPDKRVTKSALALITGLDTRAINAMEQQAAEKKSLSAAAVCTETAILDTWARNPLFRDESTGKPAILPIYGRGISFQTLVTRTAGRNVTCPTVLDRLTESGNLRLVDENHVELVNPHHVPVAGAERNLLEICSVSLNRLGRTATHNIQCSPDQPRWVHQERWSRRIPRDRLDQLRSRLRAELERQIQEIEDELDQAEAPVRHPDHCMAGVGWFYWEDCPDIEEGHSSGSGS